MINGANGQAAAKPERGRAADGRFAKGNRGGPGNPFMRQVAGFRRALCNAVTEQDIQELAALLLFKARGGDLVAVKLLLLYALGRPAEVADPDTLDAKEMQLFQLQNADDEAMAELIQGTPAELAVSVLRVALSCRAQELGGTLADLLRSRPEEKMNVVEERQ